jgi:hypothetical protein
MVEKKAAVKKSKSARTVSFTNNSKAPEVKAGAIVNLIQKHDGLEPGRYEVAGYNASGDPILKTDKGCVNVPLEKVEIVKPAAGSAVKPAKDAQQTFIKPDDRDFYIDPYGQMTINKIDTPLGKLAQRIIQGQLDTRRIEEQMTEDEDVMMKEMKKQKVQKIKVLGHQLVYQEAKTACAKLVIKDLE